jgi:hypothetical protein
MRVYIYIHTHTFMYICMYVCMEQSQRFKSKTHLDYVCKLKKARTKVVIKSLVR